MFDKLTERLQGVMESLRGRGRLTDDNINDTLRQVRMALLEADVALPVVKTFIEAIRAKVVGQEIDKSLTPGQMLIRIIHDELIALMGAGVRPLNLRAQPPVVILLAGLQGAGKTTSAAKLAKWLKENERKKVMLASTDVYRPAAILQLERLAAQIEVAFYPSDPSKSAVTLARDALAEARRYPKRFAALAMVPTIDAKEAADELERRVKGGFLGAMINGHTRGEFLDLEKYWPLLERAEALDVPIYIHPTFPPEPVMKAYFEGHEELARAPWGFSIDTGLHFLRMCYAGVFDRYPKLRIILGHLGEGIPFVMDRIHHHTWPGMGRRGLKRNMRDYILDHMIVTTSGNWSIPSLLCTVQTIGVENVLFSVDWPYESHKDAMDYLAKIPLSPADVEKIAHGNAERVLKLRKD